MLYLLQQWPALHRLTLSKPPRTPLPQARAHHQVQQHRRQVARQRSSHLRKRRLQLLGPSWCCPRSQHDCRLQPQPELAAAVDRRAELEALVLPATPVCWPLRGGRGATTALALLPGRSPLTPQQLHSQLPASVKQCISDCASDCTLARPLDMPTSAPVRPASQLQACANLCVPRRLRRRRRAAQQALA